MIQPSELRVGNWVFHFDETVVIDAIDSDGSLNISADQTGNVGSNCEVANPIPLTEEWFMKLGFEKPYKEKEFHLGWVIIKWEDNPAIDYPEGYYLFGSEWTMGEALLYVHQLQNLFFALTREELQIN